MKLQSSLSPQSGRDAHFQWAKAIWYKSWTEGWAHAQILGAAALGTVSNISSVVSNDTFRSYLDMMNVPKEVYIGIAALGIITLLAHGRD